MVHICAFYVQNNVQDTIYEYTSIKYLDNSKYLLYLRVYFIVFYSKCDISMDNSKLLLAYMQLYEQKFIINTWFVEEYILQSFEKLKTITFHKILEKRDVQIKSLSVMFMKSWLCRYSAAHYIQSASSTIWFIYRFELTYLH